MYAELLTFIQTRQESISESLKRCDTDATVHKDDSLDKLLESAKKNINVFPFSSVKSCWFQLYANVCISKATQSLHSLDLSSGIDSEGNDGTFSEAVASLDNALIIAGGGNEDTKNLIHEILRRLDHILYPDDIHCNSHYDIDVLDDDDHNESRPPPAKKQRLSPLSTTKTPSNPLPSNLAFVPKLKCPISYLNNPSLTTFESRIHDSNTPFILKNTLAHWPALTKWQDANYWLHRTLNGHRLVPIELGQSYTDEDWRQEIMTFGRFLDEYILKGDGAEEIGYLAQHDLFSQIPELRADVAVPDYCFADVPVDVDGQEGLNVKEDEEDGTGLARKRDFWTTDNSSSTTTARQVTTTTSTSTQYNSVSDEKTRTVLPSTLSSKDSSSHHDEQIQSNPSDHTNPTINSRLDTSPSTPRSLSSSSSPPQIHQNIWFGTRTVTPLHHDPYSNILTQIHGTKYIRLYSPAYTARLYPRSAQEVAPHVIDQPSETSFQGDHDGDDDRPLDHDDGSTLPEQPQSTAPATIDMSNTSTVPLWSIEQSPHEDWDEQYPGFSSVPYVEALLREGDAVYIPKGWWHYVRGVSAVGIGVSFWW